MRCYLAGSVVFLFGLFRVAAAEDPAPPYKLVTLDIVVADVPAGAAATPTAASILEQEKAGKLSGVAHYRLSGLENQQASLQFGELTPIVAGRVVRGRDAGGFGGNVPTYTTMSVGTQVTTVSRIESADAVVSDLKIQRSSISPPQPADPADPNAPPQGTVTLTVQATVRCKPGEPLLVTGRQLGSGKDATQTWVVLTASVGAAPAAAAKPAAAVLNEETLKVIQLINASAPGLAQILTETLSRERLLVAVDQRTNSLVLRGDPDVLDTARALIVRLDVK